MDILKDFRFPLFRSSFYMQYDMYKEHARKVDDFLESEAETFKADVEKLAQGKESYERDEYLEEMAEQFQELKFEFPSIQRRAELITIYTVLEHQFQQICQAYERELENPVKIKDLDSNGIIDQCRKYLEKVALVDFPSKYPAWVEITKIQQLRNCVVHADGMVKTGNQDLRGYIKGNPFLSLAHNNKVLIESGFSEHCINVFCDFLTELFDKMLQE
ncbi:hypothetical protein ACXHRA_19255 [Vibrio antiquarius]|uniref:RiboL-PSP-HEPN domain-containing protein n=1 Tax=Vibrio alginolyticus TaxID=663 RepID=A0A7Y4B7P8_VIBAL|nr:hypothetical protein [Vibrio alginolyticus]MBE3696362.1 hypothetical protein [Vibrio parahaemolyticus]EJN3360140.1 hypothetical protein [Vibrio alginolyticus]ELA9084173.1 hypothetical protein [Vibrio alginolyticus]MCR9438040.1 hypothetical protein [Vibrio alginolyticus]MCS0071491.1 hypothetical protein [Vibrio alginolyticus]